MPTGYTCELMEKGMSFSDFVMNCTRAFDVCIDMRDDPHDKPIPKKFEADTYHIKECKSERKELARLMKMTKKEKIAFGLRLKNKQIKKCIEYHVQEQMQPQKNQVP